jgi:hypothetical protein
LKRKPTAVVWFCFGATFKGEAGKTYKLVVETPTGDITAEDYLTPLGNTDYFQIIQDHTKSEELSDAIGHDGA